MAIQQQKKKINLAMIEEIREAFQRTAGRWGERRKWMAASAAAYLWLRLSPAEQDALAKRMLMADADDGVKGELLKDILRADAAIRVGVTRRKAGQSAPGSAPALGQPAPPRDAAKGRRSEKSR